MKSIRHVALAVAALATATVAWLAYSSLTARVPAPSVGYTLLDGTKARTEQLQGKVVLVNFWATSCATCVKEMPQIVATHQKYKSRGYDTLAVAMKYDPPAYVINYAQSRQLPFGVAIDNTGEIGKSNVVTQLTPTNLLINKRGEIVKRFVGEPDFAALHQLIEKLLAET